MKVKEEKEETKTKQEKQTKKTEQKENKRKHTRKENVIFGFQILKTWQIKSLRLCRIKNYK